MNCTFGILWIDMALAKKECHIMMLGAASCAAGRLDVRSRTRGWEKENYTHKKKMAVVAATVCAMLTHWYGWLLQSIKKDVSAAPLHSERN